MLAQRFQLASALVSALLVGSMGACASQSGENPRPVVVPARSPSPASTAPSKAAPPTPWARVFERECRGSITAPVVSPDQTYVGLCDAYFRFDSGTFVGRFPVGARAIVAGGGVVRDSYSGLGIEVSPLDSTSTVKEHSLGDGAGRDTIVSLDGKQLVTVLQEGKDQRVAVFSLPELDSKETVPLERNASAAVAFLADGTPLVLTDRDCTTKTKRNKDGSTSETHCASRVLARVDGAKMIPIGDAPPAIRSMVVSRDGTRAVFSDTDDQRTLFDLASMKALSHLGPVREKERSLDEGVGLSNDGKRIAFSTDDGVTVADITDAGIVEIHREALLDAEGMTFSPDSRTLFVKTRDGMVALREGAPVRAIPVPRYRPELPKGFTVTYERGGQGDSGDHIERTDHSERSLPSSVVARYQGNDADVTVSALDPTEFGGKDTPIADWSAKILARDAWFDSDTKKSIRQWTTSEGRGLEYSRFVRDGCDPSDFYVHVEERDGLLYVVEVQVPPGLSKKKVGPRIEAFFDAPFGAPREKRAFATPPPMPRGPC